MVRMDVLVNESAMAALADIGESAFEDGKEASGLLFGRGGTPARLQSVGPEGKGERIGWYIASDRGTGLDAAEAARRSAGFGDRVITAVIDAPSSSIAIYVVEKGEVRIAKAAVLEGL